MNLFKFCKRKRKLIISGILRNKTTDDLLINFLNYVKQNYFPSVEWNYWLKCFDSPIFKSTYQYSMKKVPKVNDPTNKTTLGTSVIQSSYVPSLLKTFFNNKSFLLYYNLLFFPTKILCFAVIIFHIFINTFYTRLKHIWKI